jgi:hypothetical protein
VSYRTLIMLPLQLSGVGPAVGRRRETPAHVIRTILRANATHSGNRGGQAFAVRNAEVIGAIPQPQRWVRESVGSGSPLPRPEIVHVASPESTAPTASRRDGASATVDTVAVTSEAARTRERRGAGRRSFVPFRAWEPAE